MSRRLLKAEAIVLKTSKFGEIHKRVTLLTNTEGIIYANAYGAAKGKSKLAGMVLPFHHLSVNLYYDPVKNGYKLSEAEPLSLHSGINGSLLKFYAASVSAELLLKSFGGGEVLPFFRLLEENLNYLDKGDDSKILYTLIQFFWRFISLSGLAPDFRTCSGCGRALEGVSDLYVDIIHHECYCSACSGGRMRTLPRGSINYLEHSGRLDFRNAARISLEKRLELGLFQLLSEYIEGIIEAPLVSLSLLKEEL